MTCYYVIRPGELEPIPGAEPGINREFALWSARDHDERLARIVQRNRTNNVQQARRAGYTFLEVPGA